MDEFVDILSTDEISHDKLNCVSQVIAEENLAYVNAHSKPVVPRNSFYSKVCKRVIDIVLSALALILTLPINLILGILTLFDVGRPIFFTQERVGKDGKPFIITKFRNMNNNTDAEGNLLPAKERVTKLGKIVRKTSLDELLNFWSILKGDMSIIGPRPLTDIYNDRLSERHKMRWAVRPGLECPILHSSKQGATWADQFENDVWYVENISLLTDVKLIFSLVKMTFDKKSTAVRGTATRGSFMGYNRDGSSINSQKVPIEYYRKAVELARRQ